MSQQKSNLGSFLRQARLRAGLSQKDVSRKLGYQSPQFVSNWERGLSTPPGRTLHRLAEIYAVQPEELYEILLDHVLERAERDLEREFFGKSGRRA